MVSASHTFLVGRQPGRHPRYRAGSNLLLPPPTNHRSSSPGDLVARLAAVAVAVRRGDLSQLKKASVVAALELLVPAKLDIG